MEERTLIPGLAVSRSQKIKPTRWFLVTNQLNLFFILAAGLIMSPKGFGRKYYQDSLNTFPGWIPLFADKIPNAAIKQACSEKSHLIPCLAEIDLASLSGKVMSIKEDGEAREVQFPNEIDGGEQILLIPAPLPITFIHALIFQSQEDKNNCEANARDFGNVPLTQKKRLVGKKLFAGHSRVTWPPEKKELSNLDRSLGSAFAAGAIMTMMLKMANLGDLGPKTCSLAFDSGQEIAKEINDPILSSLGEWMNLGQTPDTADEILKKHFWGAVDDLISWRASETRQNPLDVILLYLESISAKMEDRLKNALLKLAEDLKALANFGDSTISELLERHPKPFSRGMIMFFLREKCSDLLEFRHKLLLSLIHI